MDGTRYFKWTEETMSLAASMWSDGRTGSEIASKIGISRNSVLAMADRNRDRFPSRMQGLPENSAAKQAGKQKLPWTEVRLQKAAEMWNRNVTITAMAREMCVRVSTMAQVIKRFPSYFPERERPNSGNIARFEAILRRAGREEKASERSLKGFDSSALAIPGVTPVRFIDLTNRHCSFPISCEESPSGADMPCCGARRTSGSYCSHHAAIARGDGTRSERTALHIGGLGA